MGWHRFTTDWIFQTHVMTWFERGIMRALFGVLLVTCAGLWQANAEASIGEPTRVLIINSFSGENGPFSNYAAHFRAELAKGAAMPVAFYEVSLDGARFDPASDTESFVHFLKERYGNIAPDLVVPLGPPAARFYAHNRSRLFPDTPMLIGGAEQRMMRSIPLGPRDGSSSLSLDTTLVLANILQLLPDTQRIFVVVGDSQIERYWVEIMRREFKQFEGRVAIEYMNKLSLEIIESTVAALPATSAIFFPQMLVDGTGASRHHDDTLARLHAAATAPIFGLYSSQMGKGIVGGPLMSEQLAAARLANVARVILAGDTTEAINAEPVSLGSPEYDWRELYRWKIPESRLQAQSVVLFKQLTLWQQYKLIVIAGLVVVMLQSALLAGLILQRARRRRAEREALSLSGRILTAHEDERGRLARELHDDLTPRLARLAVEAARAQSASSHPSSDLSMHDELVRISEDIHGLSYRLHPTILEDLGLPDALQAECMRSASSQQFQVDLNVNGVPKQFPQEVSVCLYRIAQEALSNVARHASANHVQVSLALKGGGLQLMIVDDGAGFDKRVPLGRPSLGHASMRERVRLLGGHLRVLSAVGEGTSVVAWVPLPVGGA